MNCLEVSKDEISGEYRVRGSLHSTRESSGTLVTKVGGTSDYSSRSALILSGTKKDSNPSCIELKIAIDADTVQATVTKSFSSDWTCLQVVQHVLKRMPAIGDDYGLFVPSNSVYKTGLWLEPTKKLRDYNERGLTEVPIEMKKKTVISLPWKSQTVEEGWFPLSCVELLCHTETIKRARSKLINKDEIRQLLYLKKQSFPESAKEFENGTRTPFIQEFVTQKPTFMAIELQLTLLIGNTLTWRNNSVSQEVSFFHHKMLERRLSEYAKLNPSGSPRKFLFKNPAKPVELLRDSPFEIQVQVNNQTRSITCQGKETPTDIIKQLVSNDFDQ